MDIDKNCRHSKAADTEPYLGQLQRKKIRKLRRKPFYNEFGLSLFYRKNSNCFVEY